jgi:hypothetical protein
MLYSAQSSLHCFAVVCCVGHHVVILLQTGARAQLYGTMRTGGVRYEQGAFWAQKNGQGTLPDGGTFLGCRKVDFWFPTSPEDAGNPLFYRAPEAGLSGHKNTSFWVFFG